MHPTGSRSELIRACSRSAILRPRASPQRVTQARVTVWVQVRVARRLDLLRPVRPTKEHKQLEHAADDDLRQRPEQTHLQGREDRATCAPPQRQLPKLPIEYVHRTGASLV